MPAEDIKRELQPGGEPIQSEIETAEPERQALPSIQLDISPEIQKNLVDIIIDDFRVMNEDRSDTGLGMNAKGEQLTFGFWMKGLKKLYLGSREPKTVPWKFSSNRSMRIATAILEMLHSRMFNAVWNPDLLKWRPGS